jgi:hypothetical protein
MVMSTRREWIVGCGALVASMASNAFVKNGASAADKPTRKSFKPGEVWLDTAGKPIQAHAGSILQVGDRYYWYGENKEFTTGKTDVWTWGVRCYASTDLYNWEDLGMIIPPNTDDRSSPLHPAAGLDRPHILHNRDTKQFVCWIKLVLGGYQTRAVLVADTITGPYTIVRKDMRPLGMSAVDFDLCVNPADGKAYMYFERVHSEMICADLDDSAKSWRYQPVVFADSGTESSGNLVAPTKTTSKPNKSAGMQELPRGFSECGVATSFPIGTRQVSMAASSTRSALLLIAATAANDNNRATGPAMPSDACNRR